MKKNVIFLVLDSFIFYKIGNKQYADSPSPFLDELIKRSLFCTNLYSQGPFTEAGNKALLTGSDSLNDGGYMHNLNESENIYLDVFKKNGYETYEFFLPYYMYSNKDFTNIDHQFLTSYFIYESVYGNRLSYFSNLKKQRALHDYEYRDVIKQLELTFEAWFNMLDHSNDEKYECIKRLVKNYEWEKAISILKEENDLFLQDKIKYANKVLEEGRNHRLYKIPLTSLNNYVDKGFIDKNVYKKYQKILRKASRLQFFRNFRNQDISWKKFFCSLWESLKTKKITGYAKSVYFILFCYKLMYAFKGGKCNQELPSIRNCTNVLLAQLSKRDSTKPFFAHLHMEELHNRASFFSYDISNESYIDEEFSIFNKYIESIKNNYKGQILYDLALLYTDLCIRRMFEKLESLGLLNNTVIAICADHGCSYDCIPLRDIFTNNHHTENYHIPLIIYDGSNPTGRIIDSFHTSKDVLPTIYKMCKIEKPTNINGLPVDDENNQNDYAITEYMGGGCPDMIERPIQFMIRNDKWLVCYNVKMKEDFHSGELVEIYDLENDPLELRNLKESEKVRQLIDPLLKKLELRKEEILESYNRCHRFS